MSQTQGWLNTIEHLHSIAGERGLSQSEPGNGRAGKYMVQYDLYEQLCGNSSLSQRPMIITSTIFVRKRYTVKPVI